MSDLTKPFLPYAQTTKTVDDVVVVTCVPEDSKAFQKLLIEKGVDADQLKTIETETQNLEASFCPTAFGIVTESKGTVDKVDFKVPLFGLNSIRASVHARTMVSQGSERVDGVPVRNDDGKVVMKPKKEHFCRGTITIDRSLTSGRRAKLTGGFDDQMQAFCEKMDKDLPK